MEYLYSLVYGPSYTTITKKETSQSTSRIREIESEQISVRRIRSRLHRRLESTIIPQYGASSKQATDIYRQLAVYDHRLASMDSRILGQEARSTQLIDVMQDCRQSQDIIQTTLASAKLRRKAVIKTCDDEQINDPSLNISSDTELIDADVMKSVKESLSKMSKPVSSVVDADTPLDPIAAETEEALMTDEDRAISAAIDARAAAIAAQHTRPSALDRAPYPPTRLPNAHP